jgi:ferredoxin-NADP reductase
MDLLIQLLAAVGLAAIAFWAGSLAARELIAARAATAGASAEQALLRERLGAVAEKRRREREKSERTWDGFRKFVVSRKVLEARDQRSFYLSPHDGRPLPSFMPGQYLTFRLNVPGQAKPVIRCYSLSDSPKPDYFRVTIKRCGPPPNKADAPPGVSSCFFHDEIDEGDILDVKAPGGHFFLDPEDTKPVVLIGGGIGLTPVLSMLNAITDLGARREVHFFYGLRYKAEHAMAEHLRKIAEEHDNVHLHVCYSEPQPEDKQGFDYTHAERVSTDLFKKVLPNGNNYDFYMCGPPPMMQAVVEQLRGWGVPEERIHFEAFGPASVKRAAAAAPAATGGAAGLEVLFTRTGKTVAWDGKATLLETAEANGIKIDFGCRAGNCGTCITAVKEGEVVYPTPPGSPPEAGSCLACIAVPKSSLKLDA